MREDVEGMKEICTMRKDVDAASFRCYERCRWYEESMSYER